MRVDYYAWPCRQVCQNDCNQICPGAVYKIFIALSLLLILPTTASMAMSLGRHSGAALIGRPLDMSVQAVLDSQDDASNLCLEADVFYADNKLDNSRVRVTLEKSVTAQQQSLIRIRSSVLIDEPVVTFYLRVGCQLKTERRYVSLAELVSEPLLNRSFSTPMPPAAPVRPAALPAVNAAGNATPLERLPVAPVKEPALASRIKNQRTAVATPDNKTASPNKARLRLEPLDLTIERDPQLKSSAELLSIPAANPQERAAASALWRALSAQPQDILRDTEKLQALENSVRSLQAQSQKTLTSIDDLNVKLQQAQADRYSNLLVYGLIFLLLAALAGLAYLLKHRNFIRGGGSGDKPWWRKNDANQSHRQSWVDSLASHEPIESSPARFVSEQKSAPVDIPLDFGPYPAAKPAGIQLAGISTFVNSVPFKFKDKSAFESSLTHPSRAVKAEELLDVQQQADFFVSIGQHEQAIDLLHSHIDENFETSALVYLDLFNLYHQLNRPDEYDALRVNFNQRFNTQIPTFELYTDKNLGLEAYQLALSRIEALWPSPKVLEIIEESLFRRPDTDAEVFNLEAYRELLMLYSVAKEITSRGPKAAEHVKTSSLLVRPADSDHSQPMTFMSTAILPLSASMDKDLQERQGVLIEPSTAFAIPPILRRLGLDIDLSNSSSQDDKANSLKQSDAQFFANSDADASAAMPVSSASKQTSADSAMDMGNVIDFNVFDAPLADSVKTKTPKV